jgi:hypothetical protein
MPRGVYPRQPKPLADRFWSKVVGTDDPDACWGWAGATNNHGYGIVNVGGPRHDRALAHRLSWVLHVGAIPTGACVLHRCDRPACTNPRHLFLGTQLDNVADMDAKGRRRNAPSFGGRNGARLRPDRLARGEGHGSHTHPERWARGEQNGLARLDADAVRAVRAEYAAGSASMKAIAARYGVHPDTIRSVVRRETWTHVD